jgi:glyoxalase family protein
MGLDGIHHVTAISADAQRAIDFHAGVLGLRLVKTTVNFDAPDMYHLYFGDETGSPGSILTFFEIRGAPEGRAGAGMISRIVFRVPSTASLVFWAERLADAGRPVDWVDGAVVSSDPEGLGLELVVHEDADGAPRVAVAAGIPAEHAITGIAGVRAHTGAPDLTRDMLGRIGFADEGMGRFTTTGAERRGLYLLDEGPAERGIPGAGTVHHVAWTAPDAEHRAWGDRAREAGMRPTDVIDRQYFHSIYFREPGGVLFELATPSPGFAVDEDPAELGSALKLPPQYEPYRERIEERLTPLRRPDHALALAATTTTEEDGR